MVDQPNGQLAGADGLTYVGVAAEPLRVVGNQPLHERGHGFLTEQVAHGNQLRHHGAVAAVCRAKLSLPLRVGEIHHRLRRLFRRHEVGVVHDDARAQRQRHPVPIVGTEALRHRRHCRRIVGRKEPLLGQALHRQRVAVDEQVGLRVGALLEQFGCQFAVAAGQHRHLDVGVDLVEGLDHRFEERFGTRGIDDQLTSRHILRCARVGGGGRRRGGGGWRGTARQHDDGKQERHDKAIQHSVFHQDSFVRNDPEIVLR